jgi:hypothetical protein
MAVAVRSCWRCVRANPIAVFRSAYGAIDGPQALSLALPGPHPALSRRERGNRYRLRRRSTHRTPCERRLSTPARRVSCAVNAVVSWRWRAAWRASWYACRRTVRCRGASCAEVHARRAGHARQGGPSNRIRITGSPDTSCPGRQLTLVWPWGQRACWASLSMTQARRSSPSPSRRCRL